MRYASWPLGEIAIAGKSGRSVAGEAIPPDVHDVAAVLRPEDMHAFVRSRVQVGRRRTLRPREQDLVARGRAERRAVRDRDRRERAAARTRGAVEGEAALLGIRQARCDDRRHDLRRPLERLGAVGRSGHEDRVRTRLRIEAVPEHVDVAGAVGVDGAVLAAADLVVRRRLGELPRAPRVPAVGRAVDFDRRREAGDLLAAERGVADVDVAEERAVRRVVDGEHLVVGEERRVLLRHDHRRLPRVVDSGFRRGVVLAVEARDADRLEALERLLRAFGAEVRAQVRVVEAPAVRPREVALRVGQRPEADAGSPSDNRPFS